MAYPTSNDDGRLAAWLERRLAATLSIPASSALLTSTDWPPGPSGITPNQLETLIGAMLADPVISGMADGIDHPGLSPRRLSPHLPLSADQQLSDLLLAWFAQAGIVEAPIHPATPWRHPRRLTTTDPAVIAEALRTTPFTFIHNGDTHATHPPSDS